MFKDKLFYFYHTDGHVHTCRVKSSKQALSIARQYPDVCLVARVKKIYSLKSIDKQILK